MNNYKSIVCVQGNIHAHINLAFKDATVVAAVGTYTDNSSTLMQFP